RVAELLAEAARAGREIALTGGSTPGRAYELAAELEPDWSAAGVWWGDERCVPPDDDRSNFGLARRTLFDSLEAQPGRVHRIRGEDDPAAAAASYDQELRGTTLDLLRSEEHTSELQSSGHIVCRLLVERKNKSPW